MKLCLQDDVFLCTTDGAKVAVGLTQPQLGGYDSYCHNQIVGQGNARVLVQTSLMLAPLYTLQMRCKPRKTLLGVLSSGQSTYSSLLMPR